MKKQFFRVFLSGILLNICSPLLFARTDSPIDTTKFSVETNYGHYHYELHLPLKDESFVNRVVKILRQDTAKIANYFKYAPKTTIHFNLSEYDHEANGSATVFPIDQIILRQFPPIGVEHLTTGDDYLQGLVVHELIHIVHMDQTSGFPELVRTIFGSIGKFGGVAPRWFIEGVATWGESEFTNGGRLRNKLMRAQWEQAIVSRGFCHTIDCIDSPGVYPYRQFPYWTGAFFLEYLEKQKSGSVQCLVSANNNNIPFFLNSAFKECFGKSANGLYTNFFNEMKSKVQQREKEADEGLSIISNIVGQKDLSAGIVLLENHLITAEGDNKVRKVFSQNLDTMESQEIDFNGRLSTLSRYSDTSLSIKSFINTRDKTQRSTSIWATDSFKLTSQNGDYSFLFNEEVVEFKFKDGRWQINGDEIIFPRGVNVFYPKKAESGVFFKLVDINHERPMLAFYSIEHKKVSIVQKYAENFTLLESCGDNVIVRSDDKTYMNSLKNQVLIKDPTLDRAILLSSTNKQSAVVMENSKSSLYKWNKGCEDFKKKRKTFKRVELKDYNFETSVENNIEVSKESYPSVKHLLPRYWFFDYTAESDSLSAWGISTSLSDPDQRHLLSLRAVLYSELDEVAPDISYTYEFPFFHYLSISHRKTFSQSTLRKGNDSQELTLASYSKKFELKNADLITSFYGGLQKVDDFISIRDEKEYGLLLKGYKLRAQFDDFWQEVSFKGRFFKKDVEGYDPYNGLQSILKFNINPFKNFYFYGNGSYSVLDKTTYHSGVLYGGGSYTDFHQFYGLPYSEIFGNEIKSTRAAIKISALEIYRGSGFIPIFLEEVHLKGGTDIIAADRILIGTQALYNKSTQSWWGAVQADFTLAYAIPFSFEVIKSYVNNRYGENVNSTSTIITSSLSF
ncbi:hypothetical protein [Halobacteriovorax sp. HLS]|uniref:hypothetical protein n=1 Tax=Halobacteriovorax sp. HLS TaxID=2234000 RepID=UPI000FDAC356|nr:hypothetical protein [Halobacteriovorax sp. HLS]